MNDREQIIREAESLFDQDVLEELKQWYTYTLSGEWRYVVFTVRRSYMLALILEKITGKKMNNTGSVKFLTDAALFLQCRELADSYRDFKRFPKILLCDDVMIHGRNINHIIEGMQEELCRLLSDEYEKEQIETALVKAIEIHIYTRTWDSLLLFGPYVWKLHCMRKESPAFWRQLSSDISSMIFRADITNANYVYTEHLSDEKMESIVRSLENEGGFVRTVYQKVIQYTKCIYIGSDEDIKAVLSLRIIKNAYHDGYRVAPFAFLPNMDEEETDRLSDVILEKLPAEYRKWYLHWQRMKGMRTCNEFVTLLLSDSLLKDFNREHGIAVDADSKEQEFIKLTRNYDQYGFDRTRQMLENLLGDDQNAVFSVADVREMTAQAVSGERLVAKLKNGMTDQFTQIDQKSIRKRLEDYFYDRGCIDEEAAYELLQLSYFPDRERSKRRARGCCFTLKELNAGYTMVESKYCLAYFLQMIDAGIGSLSSYASNHTTVLGYAQFVKAGEQSLQIEPLRKYEYISMLSRMQIECGRRLRELTDEIREFGAKMRWEQPFIEMLIQFVEKLKKIGHTPGEWNGNYILKIDAPTRELLKILDRQSELRQKYVDYAREKYNYH